MWKGSVLAVLAALLVCSDASRLRVRRGITKVPQKDAPVNDLKSSSASGSLRALLLLSKSSSGDAGLQQEAGSGAGGLSTGTGGSTSMGAAGSSSDAGGTSGAGGGTSGGGGDAGDGLVECPDHMKWCTEEGFVCRMADNAEADLEEVQKEVRPIMSPTHARQRP